MQGPVSESAESPLGEPKTFSLDLNDSRLYRADDESLPTTPTPTADDAEFIPVQTKKKHHKDKQITQQRDHKLTGRRSYDSQQRATTPPPSTGGGGRSQQPSPGGAKGGSKPPAYPTTNQRTRRNSANQVKVDTDEQQPGQEELDVTSAHSRRPPQPSPKAPSEPDRSRRMSDANLS
uniref:Uncharacterized protein n=1 Tax=Plectus sambesii TaxID=2011161 RepID=A0A914UXQ9_9BILA